MKEILGMGHDIIEIERIARVHKEHGDRFLERIFTPEEIRYCFTYRDPYPSLAARFAAKEAASKALGKGIGHEIGWKDLEVQRDAAGKPSLVFSKALQSLYPKTKVLITLSHTKTIASAFALWIEQ